jgi:hypothetical protein
MPNKAKHISVAMPVGAAYAAIQANNINGLPFVLEVAGGALGGVVGGVLPDRFDPPLHPWHRSLGHGLVPVGTAAYYWQRNLETAQSDLRARADVHSALAARSTGLECVWHSAVEWFFRLLSGFVAGIGAGYISHVALDFGTARCVPVFA